MLNPIEQAISDSAYDFGREVWPVIGPPLGGGQLVPIEGVTSEPLARAFDFMTSTDAWQITANNKIRSIASRVQYITNGTPIWRSFTVRKELANGGLTEFDKLCAAIDNKREGYQYPHYFIQAYLNGGRRVGSLITAGAVRTEDLVSSIRALMAEGYCGGRFGVRRRDNPFFYVDWSLLHERGVELVCVGDHDLAFDPVGEAK